MAKNIKKILIVGGTGFIGYHLAKKCLKHKWSVVSFSKNLPKKKRYLRKVTYIIGDLFIKKNLKLINQTFDYAVNLGGYVDHKNKIKTFNSHYSGCKNLSDFLLKKNIKAFVQMGSSAEYGNLKSPQKENFICNPKSNYGQAKFFATKHLLSLYKKKKFPVTILRLYQAYGPRQDINRFIAIVIDACVRNKEFPCSNGKQFRDFIHVDDVVESILKSLASKDAKGEIINIGSGRAQKIKDIIDYLVHCIKSGKPQFGKIKLRKDEILKIYPNISKAKKILRWSPKVKFYKGLIETIRYFQKNS